MCKLRTRMCNFFWDLYPFFFQKWMLISFSFSFGSNFSFSFTFSFTFILKFALDLPASPDRSQNREWGPDKSQNGKSGPDEPLDENHFALSSCMSS